MGQVSATIYDSTKINKNLRKKIEEELVINDRSIGELAAYRYLDGVRNFFKNKKEKSDSVLINLLPLGAFITFLIYFVIKQVTS